MTPPPPSLRETLLAAATAAPSPREAISIVAPAYNEQEALPLFFDRVIPVLERTGLRWEIVVVDDGSRDGTVEAVLARGRAEPRVRLVSLARNFGKDAALTAGLDFAEGDSVVPMDVDLQDPPEVLLTMVERWRAGFDLVNARRDDRTSDGWLKRATAAMFYDLMIRILRVRLDREVGDFRLIDRRVVTVLRAMRERNRFMKGLFAWPGFRSCEIVYERPARAAGTTKWNYWKLWNFALNGIIGYSSAPLKISLYLGLAISGCSFAYSAFLVLRKLFWGADVPGYTSIMAAILVLGGIQLVSLGVIGEYLARMYEETKQRPLYVVGATHGFAPPAQPARAGS